MGCLIPLVLLSFVGISPGWGFTQHCHGDRCFWISDAGAGSWTQGRAACQSQGGDLAVMETQELYDYVKANIRHVNYGKIN